MLLIIIRKSNIFSESENEDINVKYGTFFGEFKDTCTSERWFYVIYVLRRISMVALVLFVTSPILQLSISFCFAFSVLTI